MDQFILKSLLFEYEKKRNYAEILAEDKKRELYQKYSKLQELDDLLTSLAISTTKNLIINSNNQDLLENLQQQIENLKKEKKKLLNSIGLSEDYFLPKYECTNCNDTGYITNPDYTTHMCNCLKQKIYDMEYNKSNIYHLEKQNFEQFSNLLYSDEINEEKYHSKISPRKNIELIKNICNQFISNFDDPNEKNLLFTGSTGLGKTFLSSCIANELIKKNKNVLYQTSPIMLDMIIDYRFDKNNKNKDMYNSLLNVDLLIIDDLGTECMNNMKFTELFNIINTRLLNQNKVTKTIISTNLSIKNLYDTYDERIVSRIVGNYHLCYFFGEDIRFKKRIIY